jgi:hypothetical protein
MADLAIAAGLTIKIPILQGKDNKMAKEWLERFDSVARF